MKMNFNCFPKTMMLAGVVCVMKRKMLLRSSKNEPNEPDLEDIWKKDCHQLLEVILESPDSGPFKSAVELSDFPVRVTNWN